MKLSVTQAQLETALLVSHHGHHELLREAADSARRVVMAGFAGLSEPAPQWLRMWGERAVPRNHGTVRALIPMLPARILARIERERGYYGTESLGVDVVEAARAELASRPLGDNGMHLF